jgi:hypothetical protein
VGVGGGAAGGSARAVDLPLADVASGSAVDHRFHQGRTAAAVVDDVGHDHGDVVGAAAAQRELDEPVGGGLGVGVLQRLGERLLADDAGQAVGAEQVPVAGPGLAHGEVGLDLLAVERAQQQGPLRVAVGLLGGDPAVVDERLHERVVVGDLRELAVTDQVGARVADVAEREPPTGEEDRGEGGAHALELRGLADDLAQVLAALEDGLAHGLEQVSGRRVVVEVLERGDDDLAGDVTGGVPTHAVGDRQQPRPGVDRVLVVATDEAAVGARRIAQDEGHAASSSTPRRRGPQHAGPDGKLANPLLCALVRSQAWLTYAAPVRSGRYGSAGRG